MTFRYRGGAVQMEVLRHTRHARECEVKVTNAARNALDINARADRALAEAQPEFLSQGRTSKTDPKSDFKPLIASDNQTAEQI
jgi:hypothetical protein